MSTPGLEIDPCSTDERYQSAIDFLYSRINYESRPELARSLADFPLQRMRDLLELLGNPQSAMPCIHIAGSKGKGSTATMIARILEAAGFRVGLFTSPHALRYEERFTVNQVLPTQVQIIEIVDRLRSICELMTCQKLGMPTFFELSTAAGWLHFQKQQSDIAVIEVGLGGRLDSTNLCNPLVTVISSISRDHTRLLGNTEALIAREKAGIIKPGIPVVSGVTAPEPADVIAEVAGNAAARLLRLDDEIRIVSARPPEMPLRPWSLDLSCEGFSLSDVQLGIPGEHQTRNAALAIAAIRQLDPQQYPVSEEQIRRGVSSAYLPLRIQVLNQQPTVLVDAAHNPASISALCATVADIQTSQFPNAKRVCLFSSSHDKETSELLRILSSQFDEFILTAYQSNPRAVPIEELSTIARETLSCRFETATDPQAALELALARVSQNDLICATGSFFFASEVHEIWMHRTRNSRTRS